MSEETDYEAGFDFNRVCMLLMVAKESLGFPKLKPIHDAAVAELESMLPQPEPVEEEPVEEEA